MILNSPTITITVAEEGRDPVVMTYTPGKAHDGSPVMLTNDGVRLDFDTSVREIGYEGLEEVRTAHTISWTTVERRQSEVPR